MAEFKDSSLWMRLGMLLMVLGYGIHMYSIDTPGWSSLSSIRGLGWYKGVEACEVIGYVCGLTATMLVLCLVLLDEVKGNKIAQICFIVFSIVAGFLYIVGVAIYGSKTNNSGSFSVMEAVLAGILAIISGIFGIIELVKGGK